MRIANARFEIWQGWMSALSYRQSRVSFWIARFISMWIASE
jgi:hypothetical protein